MDVWRIAKWDKVFENAESRRIKNLDWVAWPIKLDSRGYHAIVEAFGEESPSIYGAWCALVCVAATCPERGTLADSDGKPYSIGRLVLKTHMPAMVFERLFAWASSDDVAWLELTAGPAETRACPAESQPTGDERRRDETIGQRPSVRRLGDAIEIVIDDAMYATLLPTATRIARVVTRNKDVYFNRLKSADQTLAIRTVALANERYGIDWLNELLEKLALQKKELTNKWGYFRKTVCTSVMEQFGEEFRDAEKLVHRRSGKPVEVP